jgi:hypothetical protein
MVQRLEDDAHMRKVGLVAIKVPVVGILEAS